MAKGIDFFVNKKIVLCSFDGDLIIIAEFFLLSADGCQQQCDHATTYHDPQRDK